MEINIRLDRNFTIALNKLKSEFGEALAELNGLGMRQLSYTDFIDNFVDKNSVADASIDGNANVGHKDIVSLENEMSKPHEKLLSMNKIFCEITKKYGLQTANDWLRCEWVGQFYLHDAYNSSMKSYCFAYDITDLVEKGLYFIDNFNNQPPQHLNTFTDFVGEFVSYNCNRTSGAVGLPSFLVYSYYFWRKDCEEGYYIKSPEYYRDQSFQEIIYRLNQPYLRGGIQSAFTNFSIFDHPYLESIFGGKEFPDGSFVIDCIDEIIEYQKAFMRVLSEIRTKNMMTFPVLTYALLRRGGKFVDEDFAKWCCEHNMKWGDSNFFISEDVTSLSNCCFAGDQMCLTKNGEHVHLMTFRELYESEYCYKKHLTIYHNGSWVPGKVIRVPKKKMFKIVTSNKKEMIVTEDHVFPTLSGDKRADKLTTEDYLMANCRPLDACSRKDMKLTHEQGYLIGVALKKIEFFGDPGDIDDPVRMYIPVGMSQEILRHIKRAMTDFGVSSGWSFTMIPGEEFVPVVIEDIKTCMFIRQYVSGMMETERELNLDVLLQSREFREGILAGYYDADYHTDYNIHTISEKLRDQLEVLINSVGLNCTIDSYNERDVMVSTAGVIRQQRVKDYRIHWYAKSNRRKFDNIFIVRNNCEYFRVLSVEPCAYREEYTYCFEMENQKEPYFTLPNGIISHNCRLVSNVDNLGYFNSIGGTALEVGSVKVNTINLARIAYEVTAEDFKGEYLWILKQRVELCLKALDCIRHIIVRNAEKGLLPNYTKHLINIKSQYNTIGIIGIYECMEAFGFTVKDEFGNVSYTDEGVEFAKQILATINETKEEFAKDKDYMVNVEQIPGERAASVLMQKDMLFYPNEAYTLPLYGNQWIPLGIKTTLYEKVRLSAILDKACNGGSIVHVSIDAPFQNFDTAWRMLNYIADQGVTYFAFNLRISACKNNHGFYGDTCPECGEPKVTTYQRIVGLN